MSPLHLVASHTKPGSGIFFSEIFWRMLNNLVADINSIKAQTIDEVNGCIRQKYR